MNAIRFKYQTVEFETLDIHLRALRDKQQFFDPLGEAEAMGISSAQWSLFGVLWPSGEVLARKMEDFDIVGKRILEVGCGIGLASLLLQARGADITATDCHPEAGRFLAENARLNNLEPVPFLRTHWQDSHPGLGCFDVIIGSDVLYEAPTAEQLSRFIDRHSNPECEVLMVDPGRRVHTRFSKHMEELDYEYSQTKSAPLHSENPPFTGKLLHYIRTRP